MEINLKYDFCLLQKAAASSSHSKSIKRMNEISETKGVTKGNTFFKKV